MRVRIPRPSRPMRMDLTPMIDVVFNLVIFFLVASHFSNESQKPVDLPKATTSKEDEEDPRRLIVTIAADETLYIGEQIVTLVELRAQVREDLAKHGSEFAVQVRADRKVPYRAVEPILVACAEEGVVKFGFKTDQK